MNKESRSEPGFSAQEKAAMRARAKELTAEAKAAAKREDGLRDVLEAIAALEGRDRILAQGIHDLVLEAAPRLWPRTWYGMPAYALDGKVLCFFQAASKFEARYATFGFNDSARLDEGPCWPTSFALRELSPTLRESLGALVRRAVGDHPE